MTNYISTTEFAALHPEVDTSQYTAATVSGIISQASKYVDNFCQVDGFDLTTVTNEVARVIISNEGDLKIFTRRRPVQSLTSIVLSRGTWNLTLTLTNNGTPIYYIENPGAVIVYPNTFLTSVGTFTMNDLRDLRRQAVVATVTYVAGYQSIPDDIKAAVAFVTRDILQKRLNAAGVASLTQGGVTVRYSERDGKSDDIMDAERILQDYVRVTPV